MYRKKSQHLKSHGPNRAICRNCGLTGHLISECRFPVISLGVICFRRTPVGLQYLVVQRRNSYNFVEFSLGKYRVEDRVYLSSMVAMMTPLEREFVGRGDFEALWIETWGEESNRHTDTYREASIKYATVLESVREILKKTPSSMKEPEWSFPKGRRKIIKVNTSEYGHTHRKISESNKSCACREFCEETGIENSNLILVDTNPVQEDFRGMPNNVAFRHIYFIAHLVRNDTRRVLPIDQNKPYQAREVREVRWVSYEELIERTRDHNTERIDLIGKVNAFLEQNPDICPL